MFEKVVVRDACDINDLNMQDYFGVPIVTPRPSISFAVRKKTEEFVRSKIDPGVYDDYVVLKNLLNDVFSFLSEEIDCLVKELASRDLMEFMYSQYSSSCEVEKIASKNLFHNVSQLWFRERNCLRRCLKFIIEKMAEYYVDDKPCFQENYFVKIERLIELVEMNFEYAMLSTTAYGMHREKLIFEIYKPNENPFLPFYDISIGNFDSFNLGKGLKLYHEFNRKNGSLFDKYQRYYEKESESAFRELFEDSYEHFWWIFRVLLENCVPRENGVYFIPTQKIEKRLVDDYGISHKCVKLFFKTFSLTQDDLKNSPREIFRTKQCNRLKFKFILQIEWQGVTHSMYTSEMMNEGIGVMWESLRYNDLPIEWRSPNMQKTFAQITRYFGGQFEKYACANLSKWGFVGASCKKNLPNGIPIPKDVGEIDFLGYSVEQKCIVCLEFKDVRYSVNPSDYRDDLEKFIYDNNSYLNKFRKKYSFVMDNISKLVEFYEDKENISLDSKKMIVSIITYMPNIANFFIEECKCLSLAEFEVEWMKNPWQFMIEVAKPHVN